MIITTNARATKKAGVLHAGTTVEAGDWVDNATGRIACPVLSAPSELEGRGMWAMERREGKR